MAGVFPEFWKPENYLLYTSLHISYNKKETQYHSVYVTACLLKNLRVPQKLKWIAKKLL